MDSATTVGQSIRADEQATNKFIELGHSRLRKNEELLYYPRAYSANFAGSSQVGRKSPVIRTLQAGASIASVAFPLYSPILMTINWFLSQVEYIADGCGGYTAQRTAQEHIIPADPPGKKQDSWPSLPTGEPVKGWVYPTLNAAGEEGYAMWGTIPFQDPADPSQRRRLVAAYSKADGLIRHQWAPWEPPLVLPT